MQLKHPLGISSSFTLRKRRRRWRWKNRNIESGREVEIHRVGQMGDEANIICCLLVNLAEMDRCSHVGIFLQMNHEHRIILVIISHWIQMIEYLWLTEVM